MSIESPPYAFSEALEQRKTANAREQALKISQADREWLRAVFLPDQQARLALDTPMLVEKLAFSMPNAKVMDLAGSFLMTSATRNTAFAYTPGFGIEPFESRSHALEALTKRLNDPVQRDELLLFVALKVKAELDFKHCATLTSETIQGPVLPDRLRSISDNLEIDEGCLMAELLKQPTLKTQLMKALTVQMGKRFAHVSPASVTMISYPRETIEAPSLLTPRPLSTHSLIEALLKHYSENGWPQNQTREFVAADYRPASGDTPHWETLIEKTSARLTQDLQRELEHFWNEPLGNGQSRQAFFAAAMGTRFRAELLKQLLADNLSPYDHYWLSGLYPYTPARLQQVNVHAVSGHTRKPSSFKIVDAFQASHSGEPSSKYFLYTGGQLKAFDSVESLEANIFQQWLKPQRDLLRALPLQAHADLLQFGAFPEEDKAIVLAPFLDRMNTVRDSQLSNVHYIIERHHQSKGTLNLDAAFNIALDIRAMIDRQLLSSTRHGRWSPRLDLSGNEYRQVVSGQPKPVTTLENSKQLLQTLYALKSEVLNGLATRPQLMAYAEQVLSRELIAAGRTDLTPTNLYITPGSRPEEQPQSSQTSSPIKLVEHLLERSVGVAEPLSEAICPGLFSHAPDGSQHPIDNLNIADSNAIISKALQNFLPGFLQQHRAVYASLREKLLDAMDKGLRNETRQRVQSDSLAADAETLLNIVLDNPDSRLRANLNGFIPDAFSLTLQRNPLSLPEPLCNCFLITERGGLDRRHSGDALLWTPVHGLESFDSLHNAEAELNRRLSDPVERIPLLENSARAHRFVDTQAPHHSEPRIGFELIKQGLPKLNLQSLTDKALDEIGHIGSMPLSATNLHHRLQSCLAEHPHTEHLDKAIEALQNNTFRMSLPPWLANAAPDAQWALAALFDQYRQQPHAAKSIHDDIPSLYDFTRSRLGALLDRDFPGAGLNPNQLMVSTQLGDTNAVSTLSLATYALQHVDHLDDHATIARSNDPKSLPATLTIGYLKSLIKEMAIGPQYASLLDSTQHPHLFGTHLLWQSLEHGFTQVLQKSLSNSAYRLIKQVLGMPDGLAREPLDGLSIILRPLELLTSDRSDPDQARGLYLIGPLAAEQGPQILFAPHGEGPVFNEYANEAKLLEELHRTGELQKTVLSRLSEAARFHYATSVFNASPANLSITAKIIQGNLFTRVYRDHIAWLKDGLNLQTAEGRQQAWSNVVSLLKAGLYQGARHTLGRLRLPSLISQTFLQFKDAADNAWQGHWQATMEEFATALAQLALASKGQPRALLPASTITDTASLETAIDMPCPQPGWVRATQTEEQRIQVHNFEARDIALNELNYDASEDIYTHPSANRQYAAVGGSVFQVSSGSARRQIIRDAEAGPWIRKNIRKLWSLELPDRMGSSPAGQWIDRTRTQLTLNQLMNIQVTGMTAIKRLYPDKAWKIRQAHNLAVTYLRNAEQRLKSLTNESRLDRQRQAYVKAFFGVSTISRSLHQEIEIIINTLLQTVLDPIRSPATSPLYVVGTRKKSDEPCIAFIVVCDKKQKIYLTEQFFNPELQAYPPIKPRTFNISLHGMAIALLHEFCHISLDAVDIAYLNAFHPFYDLIDTSTQTGQILQNQLIKIQNQSLSHCTPVSELFRVEDALHGGWMDIGGESLERVLQLTHADGLYSARRNFLSDPLKRANVILANADSLSLLISHLGRPNESYPLFVGTVP